MIGTVCIVRALGKHTTQSGNLLGRCFSAENQSFFAVEQGSGKEIGVTTIVQGQFFAQVGYRLREVTHGEVGFVWAVAFARLSGRV